MQRRPERRWSKSVASGRPTKVNSPRRIRKGEPGYGKKKFVVLASEGGKKKTIRFGDANLSIKKNNPARKKSYCARSGGIKGKSTKLSANYWSRKMWNCQMPKDACYKKVKARVKVFPSARASQQIAKCRKAKGQVKKSAKGASLKRWKDEKWKDTRTGKPCGQGGKNEYCRPTKRVSKKTPKTKSEMSKSQLARKKAEKRKVGMGRRVKPVRRK